MVLKRPPRVIGKVKTKDLHQKFNLKAITNTKIEIESEKLPAIQLHAYSPKTNMVERHIRTLKTSLAIFARSDQRTWDQNLQYITQGINTSVSEITKFTPEEALIILDWLLEVKSTFNQWAEEEMAMQLPG